MTAIISPCGQYRYRLERNAPGEGSIAIIMVNPSTPGWWAEDNSEGDWYELNNHPSDSWGGPLAGVSHWMPLPTPPGEK